MNGHVNKIELSKLLHEYDKTILNLIKNAKYDRQDKDDKILSIGTVLKEPASTQEILEAEDRLQIKLPKSYKEFLRVSNGIYSIYGEIEEESLWPVNKLVRVAEYDPDITDGWEGADVSDEEYFIYGNSQDPVIFRSEYLETAVAISSEYDGFIFLLNTEIYIDEESEIMDLSSRHPGVFRYKNFYDFLGYFFEESIETINAWNSLA